MSRGSGSYRRLTGSLWESGIGAHWHLHQEGKLVWTVIKGIPAEMGEDKLREKFEKLGLDIKKVTMRKSKEEVYDMVVVTTERSEEGKNIRNRESRQL